MVVDVGGGTSEMAVISLGGIVVSRSVRVGGYEMDEAITHYLRARAPAGDRLADGRADQDRDRLGRCRCIPRRRSRSAAATWSPGCPPRSSCAARRSARRSWRRPARSCRRSATRSRRRRRSWPRDIARDGILLAGGGTLVRGFPELVAEETGMPVFSAESPLTCVAFGSGQALAHFDQLSRTSRHRVPVASPRTGARRSLIALEPAAASGAGRREQDQERIDRLAEARRLDVDQHDAEHEQQRDDPEPLRGRRGPAA